MELNHLISNHFDGRYDLHLEKVCDRMKTKSTFSPGANITYFPFDGDDLKLKYFQSILTRHCQEKNNEIIKKVSEKILLLSGMRDLLLGRHYIQENKDIKEKLINWVSDRYETWEKSNTAQLINDNELTQLILNHKIPRLDNVMYKDKKFEREEILEKCLNLKDAIKKQRSLLNKKTKRCDQFYYVGQIENVPIKKENSIKEASLKRILSTYVGDMDLSKCLDKSTKKKDLVNIIKNDQVLKEKYKKGLKTSTTKEVICKDIFNS